MRDFILGAFAVAATATKNKILDTKLSSQKQKIPKL